MSATHKILDAFEDVATHYDFTKNTTRNQMSKFEYASIVGKRLEQIARGGNVYVDDTRITDIREIVLAELKSGRIPFIIARTLPNGVKEYFKVSDLVMYDF